MQCSPIVLDYAAPLPRWRKRRWQGMLVVLAAMVGAGVYWARRPVPAPPKLVPLALNLPKPLFICTPRPLPRLSNLEVPRRSPRPPYFVPAGYVNLSAGRPVTGSDPSPTIGDYSLVTDGDNNGTDGCWVELMPGLQWVQIDLGAPARVYAVVVWHAWGNLGIVHDVVVQVSDDPLFRKGVTTLFNSDDDNSSGLGAGKDPRYFETNEGRIIGGKGARGRYVRLYSNGNYYDAYNTYVEVEVYGLP